MPCTIRRRASIFALSLGKEYFMPAHFIQRAQKYHSESLPRSLSVPRTEVARDRPVYSHPANYSDGVDAYIVHAKERFRGEVARWVDARSTMNRIQIDTIRLRQFIKISTNARRLWSRASELPEPTSTRNMRLCIR